MKSTLIKSFQKIPSRELWIVGGITLLGFVLRLRQYLIARALWLDEAMLGLNIVNRDFTSLLRPLDYHQGAPIGFLSVEKLLFLLLGDHELVLRFFPVVMGVASISLFYLLLRRTVSTPGLFIALALFAIGPQLITYSTEVKQYILDVVVTITCFLMAVPLLENKFTPKMYLWTTITGCLVVWFSHPALFTLAGIGFTLLLKAIYKHERARIISTLKMGSFWLVSFGLLYYISLHKLGQDPYLIGYWQEYFLPIPLWSNPNWYTGFLNDFVQIQIGTTFSAGLVFGLILIGWISLWKKRPFLFLTILNVVLLTFIVSALKIYPALGRLSLFLVPIGILLIGKSINVIQATPQIHPLVRNMLALLLGIFLLYSPIKTA